MDRALEGRFEMKRSRVEMKRVNQSADYCYSTDILVNLSGALGLASDVEASRCRLCSPTVFSSPLRSGMSVPAGSVHRRGESRCALAASGLD